MIVVDTNIIAYLFISGERSQEVEQLLSRDPHWASPILWRSEFRSVLSRYLRKNILNINETLLMIQQAEALLAGKEYQVSSAHVMKLLYTGNCSAYDCEFVALAQHLNTHLITTDKKILKEFPDIAKSVDSYLT
ncbi:MAG: type II toxin-antitoxin system VapC family toxin [Nitrospirae bacterium]|nr:type II toxin-antitoxin system VapC family toxin [Candidatus Manganitrophaceae bacterium]